MWCKHWLMLLAILAVSVTGCGGSGETAQQPGSGDGGGQADAETGQGSGAEPAGPGAAVVDFLEAVRTGEDEKAELMLTTTAREKMAELNMGVDSPGSKTADFKIGRVQYLAEDGARVACTLSDLDENLQRRTDEVLWIVRREPQGWRIAGVATTVFEGEPPVLLDFENPREMLKKQEWVQQEIHRRKALQRDSQAQRPQHPQDPIQR